MTAADEPPDDAMRDTVAHDALIASLQSDYAAEDLVPPPESASWSEERLGKWFENGGEELSCSVDVVLEEKACSIPRANGAAPLKGKLLWPQGQSRAAVGLVWCSANPGKQFGAEHMDSAIPTAIAKECHARGLALLRFDYGGVRGSGESGEYDSGTSFHPNANSAADEAFVFMRGLGCAAIAVGGHSFGANAMMTPAATRTPAAIVSSGTGPLVYKHVPDPAAQEKLRANNLSKVRALPSGVAKLFINGESDKMSPRDEVQRLTENCPEPKTLAFVPGAHNFEGHVAAAAEQIVRFVVEAAATRV